MRWHRLSKLHSEADVFTEGGLRDRNSRKIPYKAILETIKTIDGTGISKHDFSDIGKYTVFPKEQRDKVFPSRVYGRIEEDEV